MPRQPDSAGVSCPQCGSDLPRNIRFCGACGNALSTRASATRPSSPAWSDRSAAPPVAEHAATGGGERAVHGGVERAGGQVRCAAFLLDLAAMISPAMPLATAAAVLGVAEVIYIVLPVALVAVWMWLQIWQGLTGSTFGKAMLGLRLVRDGDYGAPGVGATLGRSLIFVATFGLAGLPVLLNSDRQPGWHDRISGLTVLDVAAGANPLGRRPQATLRRSANRGLNRVHSPIPIPASRRW